MEIGESLRLQEIETASSHLKVCPKCSSVEGFWFIVKGDHLFVQCKHCGVELGLSEVYTFAGSDRKPKWLRVFRE
jgi:translation initiation factor 2 beta subunit (eIF-2beta)/eIF-5